MDAQTELRTSHYHKINNNHYSCNPYALQRQNTEFSKQILPEKEYQTVSVPISTFKRFIYFHDQYAYSAGGNMWTDPGTI